MKIDAHHHFWNYSVEEYPWIEGPLAHLQRDFLPAHLKTEIEQAGIDGVVSVQARQVVEETEWLLGMANENDFIKGVVGWVPLVDAGVRIDLEKFSGESKLKAMRHVLQDEEDDNYMLREDFNEGICILTEMNLVYDILIFECHLPQSLELVDRHPHQVFVLDHIAKPVIRENKLEPWTENIKKLAEREHVFCKISGMATEADFQTWTEEQMQPYLEVVLEAFGPERLMFGSDWPVALAACGYQRWVDIVARFTSRLSDDEQDAIWGETAMRAYQL